MTSRVVCWLLPIALAFSLAACRRGAVGGSSATVGSDPAPIRLDGHPLRGALTEVALAGASLLEVRGGGGADLRLALGPVRKSRLEYYGLPCYPSAVGARQLDPTTESAERDISGCVVSLLTTDSLERVSSWYAEKLPQWRKWVWYAGGAESSGGGAAVSVEYRQPGERRRVTLDALDPLGAVLIGYEVLPEDGPAAPAASREAGRKQDDVLALSAALEDYRFDVGRDAESAGQLLRDEGPAGYRGPYLDQEPRDPYSGRPYRVRQGKVVGPGDVRGFRY